MAVGWVLEILRKENTVHFEDMASSFESMAPTSEAISRPTEKVSMWFSEHTLMNYPA